MGDTLSPNAPNAPPRAGSSLTAAPTPPRTASRRPRSQASTPAAIWRSSRPSVSAFVRSASNATVSRSIPPRGGASTATPARARRSSSNTPPPVPNVGDVKSRTVTPSRIGPKAAIAPRSRSARVSERACINFNVEATTRWPPIDWPIVAPTWSSSTESGTGRPIPTAPRSCRLESLGPIEPDGCI